MIKYLLAFLLVAQTVFAGTSYYLDPSDSGSSNTGTYAEPFNSLSTVNAYSFSAGDDLYIKVGTTLTIANGNFLTIDWDGTESDRVIIGAYYGDGLFGLNGNARPILAGGANGGNYSTGLLRIKPLSGYGLVGYHTIQDIRVEGGLGYGIEVNGRYGTNGHLTNEIVSNCYTYQTDSIGIGLWRTHNSLVDSCTVYQSNRVTTSPYSGGNAIDVGALELEGTSLNNTIQDCFVYDCNEGIGAYKGARETTIKNNTIINNNQVGVYVANSRYAYIYGNAIFSSTYGGASGDMASGITVDTEDNRSTIPKLTSYIWIHDNYIAGTKAGIKILNNSGDSQFGSSYDWTTDYLFVYNNRLVDNGTTTGTQGNIVIRHYDDNTAYGSFCYFWDNYSFIFDDHAYGLDHLEAASPTNIKWYSPGDDYSSTSQSSADDVTADGNFFNSSVGGNAGANADATDAYTAVKTSGWRELDTTLGVIDSSTWDLTSEPSADTCQSLGHLCCVTGTGDHYSDYDGDCTGAEECWSACSSPGSDPYVNTSHKFGGVTYDPIFCLYPYAGSGTIVVDIADGTYPGTLVSPDWVLNDSDDVIGVRINSIGQTFSNSIAGLGDDFTIALWFYSTTTDRPENYVKGFFSPVDGARGLQFITAYDSDSTIEYSIGNVTKTADARKDLYDQKAHLIVMTGDDSGNSKKAYLDGSFISEDSTEYSNPTWTGATIYWGGKDDGSKIFNGIILMAVAWDSVMSAADIAELYSDPDQFIANAIDKTGTVVSWTSPDKINTLDFSYPISIIDPGYPVIILSPISAGN
jgi:parallel beta-helix repeat protein